MQNITNFYKHLFFVFVRTHEHDLTDEEYCVHTRLELEVASRTCF